MRKALLTLVLLAALAAGLAAAAGGCGRGEPRQGQGGTTVAGGSAAGAGAADPAAGPGGTGGLDARGQEDREAAISHILVMHRGTPECPPGIERSREEAEERAHRIALLAQERGADFAELARRYSDDPLAQVNGGYLGIFPKSRLTPEFQVAVFAAPVGGVTQVLETEHGFHVVKREPVRRVHAHHILIAWSGAQRATTAVTRTQAQARALVEEVRLKAAQPGADLCELARQFSDDFQNGAACGDLGWIEPGTLPATIDAVLFRLAAGQVSDVLETAYGYHVFWREP